MSDDAYAQALMALEEAVDRVVNNAMYDGSLSHKDVADELRRIAQGWEDAA